MMGAAIHIPVWCTYCHQHNDLPQACRREQTRRDGPDAMTLHRNRQNGIALWGNATHGQYDDAQTAERVINECCPKGQYRFAPFDVRIFTTEPSSLMREAEGLMKAVAIFGQGGSVTKWSPLIVAVISTTLLLGIQRAQAQDDSAAQILKAM